MDIEGKAVSWFGKLRDNLGSFRSDVDDIINQVPYQYAENQLLTAGANVKQFCSEFMEEMLPESLMNSLKQKTLGELLERDANGEPTKGFSYDSSPVSMKIVEDAHTDSSLGTKTNLRKELRFKEIHDTAFPFKVFRVEAHYEDGEYNGHDDLAHNSSSSTPSKEDEESDLNDTEISDQEKELSVVSQAISILENQFLENEVSSLGHKVELSTVQGPSSSLPAEEGEVSDPVVGCNENQFLENQVSSLDHDDRSDGNKVKETEANRVAESDMDRTRSFRTHLSEDKFIMLDSSKLYVALDFPEENNISQGTVCKLCLTMKIDKQCECEREISSKVDDAESDKFGGKSLEGISVPADQDSSESDWVIV